MKVTERAQAIIFIAQNEGIDRHFFDVSPELFLLALLMFGAGVAQEVMRQEGMNTDDLIEPLSQKIGIGTNEESVFSEMLFSQALEEIFEKAIDEASTLQRKRFGTEHFLLALLAVPDGLVYGTLHSSGLKESGVRARLATLYKEFPYE